MRYSKLFAPTLREVSAEVEMTSHRLLLRGGLYSPAFRRGLQLFCRSAGAC